MQFTPFLLILMLLAFGCDAESTSSTETPDARSETLSDGHLYHDMGRADADSPRRDGGAAQDASPTDDGAVSEDIGTNADMSPQGCEQLGCPPIENGTRDCIDGVCIIACDTGYAVADDVCADIDECATDNGGCGDPAFFACTNQLGAAPECADIDECATDNGGCGDPAFFACSNQVGAAPQCADIDECATDNGGCGDPAFFACTNQLGAAPECADIDECATDNGGCGDPAFFACTNQVGAAHGCADINECEVNNGGCGDPRFTTCVNRIGGPAQCDDIDECQFGNGGCGDPRFTTCVNRIGGPAQCDDIDECQVDNGGCGDPRFTTCANQIGAPVRCDDIDECQFGNGGCGDPRFTTCVNRFGGPVHCDDIDECQFENGGCGDPAFVTCVNRIGGPANCDDLDECQFENGGCGDPELTTCVNQFGGPVRCEDVDECQVENGGCGDPSFFHCVNNVRAQPTCTDINECETDNGGCGDSVFFACTNNIGARPDCADIDECAADNGGCGDPAFFTCTNNVGARPDCADIDECAADNGGCGDPVFFACTNNVGAGPDCADIDECAANNGGCGDPVFFVCTNNVGAGPDCADIDECAADNGGCGDPTFFTCTNNVGARPDCADIDECAIDNGGCGDPVFFACTNNVGGAPDCADIDECAIDNGDCGEPAFFTCTNNVGGAPDCADIDECAEDNGGCGDPAFFACTNNVGRPADCDDIDECAVDNGGCGPLDAAQCANNIGAPPRCCAAGELCCSNAEFINSNADPVELNNERQVSERRIVFVATIPIGARDVRAEVTSVNGDIDIAILSEDNSAQAFGQVPYGDCYVGYRCTLAGAGSRLINGMLMSFSGDKIEPPVTEWATVDVANEAIEFWFFTYSVPGDANLMDVRTSLTYRPPPSCEPCANVVCPDGASARCDGLTAECVLGPPHCADFAQNEDESDVDCGGAACAPCAVGQGCGDADDCASGLCLGGQCVDRGACDDGIQNGDETDVDCGGDVCDACVAGRDCVLDADCLSERCIDQVCFNQFCAVNQYVSCGDCLECPVGTTNAAGDDRLGPNTFCESIVCPEGEILDENGVCQTRRCEDPSPFPNIDLSEPSCVGTAEGDTCTFRCAPGYEAVGSSTCSDGIWSGGACTDAGCMNAPTHIREFSALEVELPASSGSNADFTCSAGFEASGSLSCFRGEWSGGECEPSPCRITPPIPNVTPGSCQNTRSGEFCVHTCDAAFMATGRALCVNGEWELADADCVLIEQCGIPAVENGYFDPTGWVAAQNGDALDTTKIYCDQGYNKESGFGAVCECFGFADEPCATLTDWCSPISCGDLVIVEDGERAGADCVFGREAGYAISRPQCEFFCAEGYEMVGDGQIECGLDGVWPAHPTCRPIRCPAFERSALATRAGASCPEGGAVGSTCALTCDRGFSVDFGQGGGEIVCGPDGTWSEPSPCIANVCEPTAVLNSDYAGADSVVGATGDAVSVTCDNGYTALTSGAHGDAVATLQCQPDGLFTTMECVPQICD